MIKRESLQKKLAMAAMAGMLMLLLAASCVAQTPLEMGGPENCTDCSANASSSQGLDNAPEIYQMHRSVRILKHQNLYRLQESRIPVSSPTSGTAWVASQYYCLEVRDDRNNVVIKQWYNALDRYRRYDLCNSAAKAWTPETIPGESYARTAAITISRANRWNLPSAHPPPSQARRPLVSPKDTIGSKNPTFVWMPVTGCTQYRLKVANANHPNEPIFVSDYLNVEEVFSDTEQVCSITP